MDVWQKWQENHMPREEKRNFMHHVVLVISSNYLDLTMNSEYNFDQFLAIVLLVQATPATLLMALSLLQ